MRDENKPYGRDAGFKIKADTHITGNTPNQRRTPKIPLQHYTETKILCEHKYEIQKPKS